MIARERPGVSVSELSDLLDLDYPVAKAIAAKAVREENVDIEE